MTKPTREQCIEWAKDVQKEVGLSPALHYENLAIINRAYAEGQRDMRKRSIDALEANEQFYARDTVQDLEIEE